MKYFRFVTILLTLLLLAMLIINALPNDEYDPTEEPHPDNCAHNSTKILISVNWTGSVSQIPNYRNLLRNQVRDVLRIMINDLSENQNIDLSYVFFGLQRNRPDFLSNYIKTFHARSSYSFNDQDWQRLISNLRGNNIGYHTALTISRQMSIIQTFYTEKAKTWDNYYLIWITDNFFSISSADISNELNALRGWSQYDAQPNERIANIKEAQKLVKKFNDKFDFISIREITINPSDSGRHLFVKMYKIQPKPKYLPNNFISYPNNCTFQLLSKNRISLELPISFLENNIEDSGYSINEIFISLIDENGNCRKQFSYSNFRSVPSILEEDNLFNIAKIRVKINYRYKKGEDIFPCFREIHEFEINCKHTQKGKLFWLWPVKPKLLNIGGALLLFNGEVDIATFFNILFITVVILWLLNLSIPHILPSVPNVKIELIKG